jgi:hypothetical protein
LAILLCLASRQTFGNTLPLKLANAEALCVAGIN